MRGQILCLETERSRGNDRMIAPTRNVDTQKDTVRRAFRKMPILSDLSRRFHLLTTDAKPDPPRIVVEDNSHRSESSSSSREKGARQDTKSAPNTPTLGHDPTSVQPQKSLPTSGKPADADVSSEETRPGRRDSSPSNFAESKKTGARSRTKTRQSKYTQGTNVVNYNIVNSSGVKIGSRTSYICNVNQYPMKEPAATEGSWTKPKFRDMPADVSVLSSSKSEISFDDIFIIKTHIGHRWRDVARRLCYSDGQIEQFEENHAHKGIDEVIYQFLLDWKQANTKDAELGKLVSILWSCQEYDCAERLAAVCKSSS
ncbi:hypothetical protein KM043_002025 [Ampulex compressa]|nr:hypothetical protein KM043_002025 [Ampulex compressa]